MTIASMFQRLILTMIALGLSTGFVLKFRFPSIDKSTQHWIEMAGDVLLNLLQMFAVPLIITSVIAGVTALNSKLSGKTAFYIIIYVLGTTALAVLLGMFLVTLIHPGGEVELSDDDTHSEAHFYLHVVFMDIIRNIVPESFFQAFYEHYQTDIVEVFVKPENSTVDPTIGHNVSDIILMGGYTPGANMLGLIIWSFTFGIMLNNVGGQATVTVRAAREINNAIKIIFKYILWYMPIGIYFLMVDNVLDIEDWDAVIKLGKLLMVLFLGFAIHSLIVLPLVYHVFTRQNPYLVFKHTQNALMNAIIMASSSATLPITLQCCEENMKVDARFCRLMLPIVSSINMNGMAIYEVIAAVFIAQRAHIFLDVGRLISIGLTSAVASFGAAGVPMLGPASTIMILTAVGLPARDVSILMVFEWFIDHFATLVNVLGDCFGVGIISRLCESELEEMDKVARIHSIGEMELDLLCLESNDEFFPSGISFPAGSISPK